MIDSISLVYFLVWVLIGAASSVQIESIATWRWMDKDWAAYLFSLLMVVLAPVAALLAAFLMVRDTLGMRGRWI